MKKLKALALLALSFSVSCSALAQAVPDEVALRKLTDQIMVQVGKGDLEAAFRLLKPRTVVPEAEVDAMVGQVKLQLPALTIRFGNVLGQEFVQESRVGQSLVRYTYIQRFDKHAMRWVFYGYHGKDGWFIDTFRFDDQIQTLFP